MQAAEEGGIYAIAYHSDMSEYGKKAQLTAAIHNFEGFYVKRVQQVMDGTWKSENFWEGISAGMTEIAPFNDAVPADVAQQVKALSKQIAAKTFHPFTGPIKDQAGKLIIPVGEVIQDNDLLRMDFYVEGVYGKLKYCLMANMRIVSLAVKYSHWSRSVKNNIS